MADNTILDPGAGGDTIATDDIAGVKHQRVKVEFGSDGSATDVSSANPLPTVQTGALPAGTNNIGDVDVLTLPSLPAGTNNIGDVDVLSMPPVTATVSGEVEATSFIMTEDDEGVQQFVSTDDPVPVVAPGIEYKLQELIDEIRELKTLFMLAHGL